MNWLAMAVYIGMFMRYGGEDVHFLRRILDSDVEGQRKKGRLWMIWNMLVGEERVILGLSREDALCRSIWIECFYDEVNLSIAHLLGILPDFNIRLSAMRLIQCWYSCNHCRFFFVIYLLYTISVPVDDILCDVLDAVLCLLSCSHRSTKQQCPLWAGMTRTFLLSTQQTTA